jgi:hypothetical protein
MVAARTAAPEFVHLPVRDGCLAMKVGIGSGLSVFERRTGADFGFRGLTPFF